MDGTVLVADDDRTIRTVLTQAFSRAGCKVHATASLKTLMRWVGEGLGDLVISDVVMPDGNGLEMLPKIADLRPGLPVIIISAQNTITTAIQAAEAEAHDYLPKPFDLPDLMKRSARAMARRDAHAPASQPRPNSTDDLPLVGRSQAMQELYRVIARVVNTDLPVLISGESGTGKSLIAHTIHDFSDRRYLPFVVAGAAELEEIDAIAEAISRARAGTILFDEIADMSPAAQARLVRQLDGLPANGPRLMATSQADLGERLESGALRGDLYYRLNAIVLSAPPLRQRIDDIPLLAEHFLARSAREHGTVHSLSAPALELLRRHTWPGNVRELGNIIRRLTLVAPQEEIGAVDVEGALGELPGAQASLATGRHEKLSESIANHLARYFDLHGGSLPPAGLYARILREMEQPLIEIALDSTGGNQAKCAELLGINRNTLRKKINQLDIRVTKRRQLM